MGWVEGVILSFSVSSSFLAAHLILSIVAGLGPEAGLGKLNNLRESFQQL